MSYLLDRKHKRKKFIINLSFVLIFFVLFYFRSEVFSGLSFVSSIIFRPVLIVGNNLGEKFSTLGSYFSSKRSLYLENENLKSELSLNEAKILNYNSILTENIDLKEILGRQISTEEKQKMVLATILSKPNQSLFDTLIIDVGANANIKEGSMVFALGNVPIGRVASVYPNSSKVILFSNSGEKTQAMISAKNVFMEVVGRGGGNFEMILPRDFILLEGDQVVLPGIVPQVLGTVRKIISDPRDPFQKALLVSPVNIQEIKFVQVEPQK